MDDKPNFVAISTVQGELVANVIKSHLESEGIPVVLQYDDIIMGKNFGPTLNKLAQVNILVPQELAEEARQIIKPREPGQAEE